MLKDWQPIETAPKHREGKSNRYVRLLVTRIPFNGGSPCVMVRWGRGGLWNKGAWGWVIHGSGGKMLNFVPTHWHPLPSFE